MFTLSLLLQAGLGESAVAASAMFFCQGVLFTATSLRSGRLAVRLGRRVPVIGAGLVVIGLIALAVVLAADPRHGGAHRRTGSRGRGQRFLLPPLLGAALTRVGAEDAGAASGTLNTAQQFANSLGVTVIGTVFFTVAGAGVAHAAGAMQVVIVIYAVLVLASFHSSDSAGRGRRRRPDLPAITPARAVRRAPSVANRTEDDAAGRGPQRGAGRAWV